MIGARRFASALSEHPDPRQAAGEVVGRVLEETGQRPDLAVLFLTEAYVDALGELVSLVQGALAPTRLVGSTAGGVLAGSREVEDGPGLALWAGRVGPTMPARLEVEADDDGGSSIAGLVAFDDATNLVLADPYSFPIGAMLDGLVAGPETRFIGGLASAPAGRNRLILDDGIYEDGAVSVRLATPPGPAVVSQGCGPIGDPYVVTDASGNVIRELAGLPASRRLQALLEAADEDERQILARSLHLGVVVDEGRLDFGRGDFLVRGLLGVDPGEGTITVGDVVEVGQTVQFHRRDAAAASEDLHSLLSGIDAEAALVFTCNGRGRRLFDVGDHDARAIAGAADPVAVAGMFCAGEIGPVGLRSHVHGFTASTQFFARP